jgi:hypothetical protein
MKMLLKTPNGLKDAQASDVNYPAFLVGCRACWPRLCERNPEVGIGGLNVIFVNGENKVDVQNRNKIVTSDSIVSTGDA